MIIDIGNIVIDKVKDLPFIDKYAGVVKVITYNQPTEEGRVLKKIFPVSCRLSQEDCVTSGQYLDLCPDSKKKSVLYLEDKYVRFIKRDGDIFYFQASFDLICWLNIPLLGLSDCTISSKAILSTINSLVSQPFNSSIYQRISISPLGEEGKTRNPFAKYTYDEAVNQFLMHPFDYFILPLNVDFAINKKCINDFEVGAPIGCYTPAEGCCNEVPVPSPAINCETLPNCQTIIDIIDRIEALEASSGGGSFDCSALAGCQTILDLESSISQEETARQNADTALQNAISQEVTDRQAQGMYLENYIDQVSNDLSVHSTDTNNPHQTTLEQARSQNSSLSGDINANTNTIINLRDAVAPQEPITKSQFDSYNASVGRQRGSIDCSANPNYPASNVGDRWEVTVAGKIGGASGITVQVYDEIVCKTASVSGDQATVGMNFYVIQGNVERASESVGGYIQLATDIEVQAETNNEKAVTPLKLGNWWTNIKTIAHTFAAKITFTISPRLSSNSASTPLAVDSNKDVSDLTDSIWGAFLNGLTGKTTPVDTDSIGIVDSADSNKSKKLTFTNLKAFLKTYFDTQYANSKQITLFYQRTEDVTYTGFTGNTFLEEVEIPANYLGPNSEIEVSVTFERNSGGTSTNTCYVGLSNSSSTFNTRGYIQMATGQLQSGIFKRFVFKNGNDIKYQQISIQTHDFYTPTSTLRNTVTLDRTQPIYVSINGNLGTSTDRIIINEYRIMIYNRA